MASKRGASGLSLVVGVDKPTGMSSHDVVNRVRRIFGERRVGHAGTLDPMASGVLPVCVGPATRLDNYMVGHDKTYLATVVFGTATDTCDSEGAVTDSALAPECVCDVAFAHEILDRFTGPLKQMPPAYSAIKVGGVKACDAARSGKVIDLQPRDIEVYKAVLVSIDEVEAFGEPMIAWQVRFSVSKGTYIRSLARDMGNSFGCPSHLGALRRECVGKMRLEDCVSLDTLEELGTRAALDPVDLLEYRFIYGEGDISRYLANGNPFRASGVEVFDRRRSYTEANMCACTSGVCKSCEPVQDGELFSVIENNELKAIYRYDSATNTYRSACMFSTPVSRGMGL